MPRPLSRGKHAISSDTDDALDDAEKDLESEWSDDDPRAFYRNFKDRKTAKRKRVAEETNRIRAEKKSKITATTSIVGRKPAPKKKTGYGPSGFSTDSVAEDAEGAATFLDEPIPEYIISRQRTLKTLHEAGLRYPPSYRDVEFSDPVSQQKPKLHKAVKPQREKKDIELLESVVSYQLLLPNGYATTRLKVFNFCMSDS